MQTNRLRPAAGAAIITILSVAAAGALGSVATVPNIPTWYAGLHKPAFTPPNWLFGPAWTCLYVLMGISFYRILRLPRAVDGKKGAVAWFSVQLLLNAFWSVAFFGLHSPIFGLAVIALLWLAISATIVRFYRLDPPAALLLIPYLLWVSFAAALNAGVYMLNR